MTITRRTVLQSTLALASHRALATVMPNVGSLAPTKAAKVDKVFHLRAEPVKHAIAPGLEIEAWGYNGTSPGPLLEATEGERVRIYVTNKLREATSIH